MLDILRIPIQFENQDIELLIYPDNESALLFEQEDALENGEAIFQIMEGCNYEYSISPGFSIKKSEVIFPSKANRSTGRISPNVFVGTVVLDVLDENMYCCTSVKLEVRSAKASYREDYRHMLQEIAEKCTELIFQHNSPTSQYFESDYDGNAKTAYQRFAFIKSVLDSQEFTDAINKIISAPVTNWKSTETTTDTRNLKKISSSTVRQLITSKNRVDIPNHHPLASFGNSIPQRVSINKKIETIDTPENRFIKHALTHFMLFCSEIVEKLPNNSRARGDASRMTDLLERHLSNPIFKEISSPKTLPLNSPVLQKRSGYREILKAWLMFDLASKLIWNGGDDVYSGNKRDVASLYEYWLFFKLLETIVEVFKVPSPSVSELIEYSSDGLGLKLKQGKHLAIDRVFTAEQRKLNVQFSYNRTFNGQSEYPKGGSWTRSLRPDYTLSVWPHGISQEQAENEELIVHIHFDAKYKIENLLSLFNSSNDVDQEKEEEKKGTYKRADILKMHTYRDAIRRTAGAYVLYPGNSSDQRRGFHELLPGLGAFAIRPSSTNNGTEDLKLFLSDVISHFVNRATQRERIALKAFQTYKDKGGNNLTEALPEPYGINRSLLPDETFVLVGYYRKDNWKWILASGLYNARAESQRGSLRLGLGAANAKYLLLHTDGETVTGKLLKIIDNGPRIFSKQKLLAKGYPSIPSQDFYLVYKVEPVLDSEFANASWDITLLDGFSSGRGSALPFSVSLTELMKALKK